MQYEGVSTSKGYELSSQYSLNDNWRLIANYTHNEAKRSDGSPRLRRPEELANLGVSFNGLDERLNLNAFYRISRDSFDQVFGEPIVALEGFEVLDLTGSFNINDTFQVYGRVENATNEKYREILGYNSAERAAYVGVKVNFTGF